MHHRKEDGRTEYLDRDTEYGGLVALRDAAGEEWICDFPVLKSSKIGEYRPPVPCTPYLLLLGTTSRYCLVLGRTSSSTRYYGVQTRESIWGPSEAPVLRISLRGRLQFGSPAASCSQWNWPNEPLDCPNTRRTEDSYEYNGETTTTSRRIQVLRLRG